MTEVLATAGSSGGTGPERTSMLAGKVLGHGLFRIAPGDAPALRKRPGPVPDEWGRLPASLLRYSDEQSVAGVAAVFTAMQGMNLPDDRFASWGVVVASRYLGRANLALALRSFAVEGVWGVSPHLIPHFALHSPSGTISLALGLHGPNLGVGGGQYSVAEGFLAALTWLTTGVVPGVWLVLSGWAPELVPGQPNGECRALAVALAADDRRGERSSVRIVTSETSRWAPGTPDLRWLGNRLASPANMKPRSIAADPSGRMRVELLAESDGPGTDDGQG